MTTTHSSPSITPGFGIRAYRCDTHILWLFVPCKASPTSTGQNTQQIDLLQQGRGEGEKVYAQIESRQQFRHAVRMRTAEVALCIEDEASDTRGGDKGVDLHHAKRFAASRSSSCSITSE